MPAARAAAPHSPQGQTCGGPGRPQQARQQQDRQQWVSACGRQSRLQQQHQLQPNQCIADRDSMQIRYVGCFCCPVPLLAGLANKLCSADFGSGDQSITATCAPLAGWELARQELLKAVSSQQPTQHLQHQHNPHTRPRLIVHPAGVTACLRFQSSMLLLPPCVHTASRIRQICKLQISHALYLPPPSQ